MATNPQQDPRRMIVEDYLEFEKTSEIKHEYIDGYIYAMAGRTENHSLISTNLLATLHTQRRKHGCAVHTSDMRVQISESKYVYPDASIVCGEARLSLVNPTIVIEVMSPSSEAYDRGDKFEFYRKVSSLQHYVLVSQEKPRIEGFTRQPSGLWTFSDAIGIDATFTIETGDFTLALVDIYADIEFDRQDD
ncbi:MAG: Uma2 family endonuclease [Chloroflexota bacterium]